MIGASAFIGKFIGSYRIVAVISSSPFNHVYCGEQPFHTGPTVAIKLWHTLHLSLQKQLHFLQEARLLKMLKHPHLLPIMDMGIHEDMPYLITAYAPKGSLRDRIQRQSSSHPVPFQEIVTLLSQVGQVLQYVHQYDITHGNLKPGNILLTARGEALLTDFTFSTLLEAASSTYAPGITSARYMAPEQFQGVTSKASDQYALGCIAYELLTGRVPFTAVDFSGLGRKHATENPLALTELNMLLPIHIEEAILQALAKQQTARHASMKDFITALGTASFQPRLLIAPAALPALSSSWSPARLTSTDDTSQGIKQQVEEDSTPRKAEHAHISSDTQGHIETLFPVRPEEFEEEEGHQEDVKPLAASPAEVLEEGAEGRHVHTHRVTEGVDVSVQENAISLLIEGPPIQHASQEQATLPMVVAVNSWTASVTGTYANAMQAVPPITVDRIGRGRRSGNQGSRYLWLAITISSIVIVVILIGLSSFAVPLVLSPRTTARVTPQAPVGGPSAAPSQVPSPMTPASPSPQSSPKATPTAKPTPTPSPTPGLIVTPSQFSAATDCTRHGPWYTCSATLSAPQSNQGNLAWSAFSSGLDQVSFNPSAGVLSPGQEQQVTIRVRGNCLNAGSLIFSGRGRTANVPWSC